MPEAPRVLIVDDNVEFRSMLQDRLTDLGFVIVDKPADTLVKVIDAIQNSGLNAIVLDIHMSGLNGFDVLKAIRKVDPYFPAIMMTGSKNAHSMKRALELGCNTMIEKPCDIDVLAQELRNLIESRRNK